jgi:glycine/D-amino acid oxidase-like deaminating enzyme
VKKVDYIIVGFGIAGAALALQLRKRGFNILIFDQPYEHQASRVAAGLFNPVTGKLMTRTWNADKLFPYLHDFYREAEKITSENFFYPTPICIPFKTIKEQNDWSASSEDVYTSSRYGDFIDDKLGGVILKSTGYVDTVKYLEAVGKLFDIRRESFDYDNYRSFDAKAIIFCEGIKAKDNPFFKWVPVRQLKGETLNIGLEKTPPLIFNRGVYIVPTTIDDKTWKVGATYSHDISEGVTEAGRKELHQKLDSLLTVPYTATNHSWGIRPTTPDRRPILGPHPEYKNILIFNGMGTKGVSLAPWCSGILCDYLAEGLEIKNDINISRFYALYSKFRD